MSAFRTAELCDHHAAQGHLQVLEPLFSFYGARRAFCGAITTLKVFEDDALVRQVLSETVTDRVLVIDGGGSHRCALLDATSARQACDHGWQGLVIYGCIRDRALIDQLPLGVLALHTHPFPAHQRGHGERDLLLTFAGVNFKKDHYLYADADGVIVSGQMLR